MSFGRVLACGLLVCALLGPGRVHAEDSAPVDVGALVQTWLEASGSARGPLTSRLRALGAKAAPAVRAAEKGATAAQRKRLGRLLARLREDHQRAATPAGMIYIPAGLLEVPRGAAPWGPSGTRRHVDAFYLARTEVTVGQWRAWLAALERAQPGSPKRLGLYRPREDLDATLPATRVRHPDAERYARNAGARLPTADEFERALRGSGVATWPWGDRMRKGRANLLDQGPGGLTPVGSYPAGASAFGVLDLVGNAAEWSATFVAQGQRGRYALVLGGSYIDAPNAALTWRGLARNRARVGTRERQGWIGFRLARDAPALPD